jgi:hypothetical protein
MGFTAVIEGEFMNLPSIKDREFDANSSQTENTCSRATYVLQKGGVTYRDAAAL